MSGHFNYKMENHHRAMPDVLATHHFFERFLDSLKEQGVTTLFQLIDLQKEKITKKNFGKKSLAFTEKIKRVLHENEARNKNIVKIEHMLNSNPTSIDQALINQISMVASVSETDLEEHFQHAIKKTFHSEIT